MCSCLCVAFYFFFFIFAKLPSIILFYLLPHYTDMCVCVSGNPKKSNLKHISKSQHYLTTREDPEYIQRCTEMLSIVFSHDFFFNSLRKV